MLNFLTKPAETEEPTAGEALAAASAEVRRLEERQRQARAEYRHAGRCGDGPTMLRLKHEIADLDELLLGARIAAELAAVALHAPGVAEAQALADQADEEYVRRNRRLPYGRIEGLAQEEIVAWNTARARAERAHDELGRRKSRQMAAQAQLDGLLGRLSC